MANEVTRGSDERGRRWYVNEGSEVMSVTTILRHLDQDKTGLRYWRRNNQGAGDDKHHEHVMWVAGIRGTLAHWRCLEPLTDRQLWGEEEQAALEAVNNGPEDGEFTDASHGMADIHYSAIKNKDDSLTRDSFNGGDGFAAVIHKDVEWVADEFDRLKRPLGIHDNAIIAVEQYLFDHKHGFGGQCDLLYESPSGETVLADLKTSSGLRQKHIAQVYAYAIAVEQDADLPTTVDRCEVIRMSPDTQETKVHSSQRPLHVSDNADWFTTQNWFEDQYGDYSYDGRADVEDEFQACIDRAYEDDT